MTVTVQEFDGGWLVSDGQTEARFYHNAAENCGESAFHRAQKWAAAGRQILQQWADGFALNLQIG